MAELIGQYHQLQALLKANPTNPELLSTLADLRELFTLTGQQMPTETKSSVAGEISGAKAQVCCCCITYFKLN